MAAQKPTFTSAGMEEHLKNQRERYVSIKDKQAALPHAAAWYHLLERFPELGRLDDDKYDEFARWTAAHPEEKIQTHEMWLNRETYIVWERQFDHFEVVSYAKDAYKSKEEAEQDAEEERKEQQRRRGKHRQHPPHVRHPVKKNKVLTREEALAIAKNYFANQKNINYEDLLFDAALQKDPRFKQIKEAIDTEWLQKNFPHLKTVRQASLEEQDTIAQKRQEHEKAEKKTFDQIAKEKYEAQFPNAKKDYLAQEKKRLYLYAKDDDAYQLLKGQPERIVEESLRDAKIGTGETADAINLLNRVDLNRAAEDAASEEFVRVFPEKTEIYAQEDTVLARAVQGLEASEANAFEVDDIEMPEVSEVSIQEPSDDDQSQQPPQFEKPRHRAPTQEMPEGQMAAEGAEMGEAALAGETGMAAAGAAEGSALVAGAGAEAIAGGGAAVAGGTAAVGTAGATAGVVGGVVATEGAIGGVAASSPIWGPVAGVAGAIAGAVLVVLLFVIILTGGEQSVTASPPISPTPTPGNLTAVKPKLAKTGLTQVPNGELITYTIKASFPGVAQSLIVTDQIPSRATFDHATGPYTFSDTTKTVTWTFPGGTSAGITPDPVYLSIKPLDNDTFITNIAHASATGVSGGSSAPVAIPSGTVPATTDDCHGKWAGQLVYNGLNFGDPSCDFNEDDLLTEINQLDAAHLSQWKAIVKCESGYNPSNYLAASESGLGAFGLFQMNPAGKGNGQYDAGNVIWQLQTSNAITYNKQVIHENFRYWACAQAFWGGGKPQ